MRLAHRFDASPQSSDFQSHHYSCIHLRLPYDSGLGTWPARALKSCSSVMQQSVSIRRPLLVSDRYVLVNIILDTSLEYGLTTRPRANTIIDTVTYLVDGTYRRWFWGCSEPPRAGTTSSRGTLGPEIGYIYPYPTYGGVETASGGLQAARRLATSPRSCIQDPGAEGVKVHLN